MNRWENIGDKYLLNALGADPLAASQSVAMYLDPVARCIEWHTNGHVIRLRPDLPSAIISGPFATSFGYEWNLAGGVVFGIGDVSLTKRAGVLDSWGLQGVQIYYIVPVGQIPNTPTINIEKIDILDGMIDQLSLTPQGVLSVELSAQGTTRAGPWVDNSMVMSWVNKRHNNSADNHSNYMAAKVLQKAPPLAHPLVCADLQAGNASNRSFGAANGSETTGWYEVLAGGFQKAFNRQNLEDNRGVGTHYAFAATLGYTSIGSTATNYFGICSAGGYQMPEDGTVTDINFYCTTNNNNNNNLGLYDGTALTCVSSSLIVDAGDAGNTPNSWLTRPTSTPVAAGKYPWITTQASNFGSFRHVHDVGTHLFKSAQVLSSGGNMSATWPASALRNNTYDTSAYFTYTPSGGGSIIPQIMHHRQQQGSA